MSSVWCDCGSLEHLELQYLFLSKVSGYVIESSGRSLIKVGWIKLLCRPEDFLC